MARKKQNNRALENEDLAFLYGYASLPPRGRWEATFSTSFKKVRAGLRRLFYYASLDFSARQEKLETPHGKNSISSLERANNNLSVELRRECLRWSETEGMAQEEFFCIRYDAGASFWETQVWEKERQQDLNERLARHLQTFKITKVLAFVRATLKECAPAGGSVYKHGFMQTAAYGSILFNSGEDQPFDPLSIAFHYALGVVSKQQAPILLTRLAPGTPSPV
jgi:hypothetical protein